ncbi:104L [Invertebrate iridescent virus Kaz2018]|nr:104L [Invertebrate iridescent virus Kaz2018]
MPHYVVVNSPMRRRRSPRRRSPKVCYSPRRVACSPRRRSPRRRSPRRRSPRRSIVVY